jgi:uncharacterized protein (DUF1697 family)
MAVIISLLRGINLGGHKSIKMEALCSVYKSIGFGDVQSCLQSGNIVFTAKTQSLKTMAKQIEEAIEQKFGFRCDVVLRTSSELKQVVANNPFAKKRGIEPGKLGIVFFKEAPTAESCDDVLRAKTKDEQFHINGREFYIYFGSGMGQSKLFAAIARKLTGTTRNWNTVSRLAAIAEKLEASA